MRQSRFRVNRQPDLVGTLTGEIVKTQRTQQANHPTRNSFRRLHQRVMLAAFGTRSCVKSAPDSLHPVIHRFLNLSTRQTPFFQIFRPENGGTLKHCLKAI